MSHNSFRKIIKPRNIILVILLVALSLILRWNHFTAPFERDEGVYAYSAWVMRQGLNPYEYSFPYKPPMIIYTNLLSQLIFGDHVWGIRLLAFVFSLGTIFFIYKIAKLKLGEFAAWVSAFLLSVMLILPVNFGRGFLADVYYAANTEIFMLLPLTALLYLSIRFKNRAKPTVLFFAGVLAAMAINYKPICLPVVAFIFIVWVFDDVKTRAWMSGAKKTLLAFFGGLFAFIFIYLPFLLNDSGRAVYDQLVGFTGCYKNMGNWNFTPGQFVSRLMVMGKYYWVFYLVIVYVLVKKPKQWRYFCLLLLVAYLSVYQSVIGHYYLTVMPALAILVAMGIDRLTGEKLLEKIGRIVITMGFLLVLIWPVRAMFGKTPEQLGLWVYGPYDPYFEAEFIGQKVRQLTDPGDYIFVEGSDPEIIYFAQRRHATKMEWTYFYQTDCPFLDSYKREYERDLEEKSPAVIVTCQTGSCAGVWEDKLAKPFMDKLSKLLDDEYRPIGGWVPTGEGGYWLQPISKEELSLARSVIYRKYSK